MNFITFRRSVQNKSKLYETWMLVSPFVVRGSLEQRGTEGGTEGVILFLSSKWLLSPCTNSVAPTRDVQ